MKKLTGCLVCAVVSALTVWAPMQYFKKQALTKKQKNVDKFYDYYQLMNQWLALRNEGKSIEKYFLDNGCRTIAIYGLGEPARRMYEELKNSHLVLKYGIDRDVCNTSLELKEIFSPEDTLPPVDVIVVTPIYEFQTIEATLKQKTNCQIISLEDVVYGI